MELGLIGLGRMGLNMAKRLSDDKHRLAVYDSAPDALQKVAGMPVQFAASIAELKNKLTPPRAAWIMVPHGDPTDAVINELAKQFEPGDIVIDGGNSHFLTSIARMELLKKHGINFLDVGVSGGVFGLERGYCLMIGGEKSVADALTPIFRSLAPGENTAPPTKSRTTNFSTAQEGYYYCGPSGAGHYVKMIHNAIEYGLMQAYAEGLELLGNANGTELPEKQRYDFDLREICELWRRGSVVSSWLLDLMSDALYQSPTLTEFSGMVPDSGEGRWALIEAIKQATPVPNIASALFTRFRSRQTAPLAERSLSALRKEFGGHSEAGVIKK